MELTEYVDERITALLKRLLPNLAIEPTLTPLARSSKPSAHINLPAAPRADYHFRLYLLPEKQIHAVLLNAAAEFYFWYMPFEEAEYDDSVDAFVATLELLVSHETHIVQKRGLLNHSFTCDYKSVAGWKRICGFSAFRFGGFKVPPIKEKKRVYCSPALVAS
jgi:hypothetical protein